MYIKMSVEQGDNFIFLITEEIAKFPNLNLEVGADIRRYLTIHFKENLYYVRVGLFDMPHGCRSKLPSDAETTMWNDMISMYGWETVERLPETNLI